MLAQQHVDEKVNEITQVRPLLEDLDVAGAPVTADACAEGDRPLPCPGQRADYLFAAVKGGQPTLFVRNAVVVVLRLAGFTAPQQAADGPPGIPQGP